MVTTLFVIRPDMSPPAKSTQRKIVSPSVGLHQCDFQELYWNLGAAVFIS